MRDCSPNSWVWNRKCACGQRSTWAATDLIFFVLRAVPAVRDGKEIEQKKESPGPCSEGPLPTC